MPGASLGRSGSQSLGHTHTHRHTYALTMNHCEHAHHPSAQRITCGYLECMHVKARMCGARAPGLMYTPVGSVTSLLSVINSSTNDCSLVNESGKAASLFDLRPNSLRPVRLPKSAGSCVSSLHMRFIVLRTGGKERYNTYAHTQANMECRGRGLCTDAWLVCTRACAGV